MSILVSGGVSFRGVLHEIAEIIKTSFTYVTGNFTRSTPGMASAEKIINLNADGSVNSAVNFGSGFGTTVGAIAIQTDGKILVGGLFTTYQGVTQNRFVRLNADGSADSTFNTGTGFSSAVSAIAIQSDGKILAVGQFSSYQGVSCNRIARLNVNGSLDTTFSIGTGFGNSVGAIAIQTDGKILVGGQFTTYQGITRNRIVRLNTDGSIDNTFNVGNGFVGGVNSVTIQPDGKILVGGAFTTYQSVTRNRFIRLNSDGSIDGTFNVGTGFSNIVYTSTLQADGKILVGGLFTSYQGVTQNRIVRLNADGSIDNTFTTVDGFNNTVNCVSVQSGGKILVGGGFTTYQGVTQNYIARLNTDGSVDSAFNVGSGFNSSVTALAVTSLGKIFVGGLFSIYQGVTQNKLVRLNAAETENDTAFAIGTGFNNTVNCVSVQSDGKIIAGGDFTTYQGVTQNRIVRLNTDGSVDNTFNVGLGFNFAVQSIIIRSNGKIVVGGNFDTYQSTTANHIVQLNTDGSIDGTFNVGAGFSDPVMTMTAQADGKILVGGVFTTYQGVTQNYIARLNTDGSIDNTFVTGVGFDNFVNSILVQSDNKIVVSGEFLMYQETTKNYIVRLHADGSVDNTFVINDGFDNTVYASFLQPDGKILVGGNFANYQGTFASKIVRLNTNGSIDNTFVAGTGFNSAIRALAVHSDGKILVGGNFTSYNLVPKRGIVRLNIDGSVDNTLDLSVYGGVLSINIG